MKLHRGCSPTLWCNKMSHLDDAWWLTGSWSRGPRIAATFSIWHFQPSLIQQINTTSLLHLERTRFLVSESTILTLKSKWPLVRKVPGTELKVVACSIVVFSRRHRDDEEEHIWNAASQERLTQIYRSAQCTNLPCNWKIWFSIFKTAFLHVASVHIIQINNFAISSAF